MTPNTPKIFENKQIRTHWDEETETWFFSVVDVIAVLTESRDPQSYWRKLKERLKTEEKSQTTPKRGGLTSPIRA